MVFQSAIDPTLSLGVDTRLWIFWFFYQVKGRSYQVGEAIKEGRIMWENYPFGWDSMPWLTPAVRQEADQLVQCIWKMRIFT
jgi:hypothetical protein